jgi:DNA polymerase-1
MQVTPQTKDAYTLLHEGTQALARAERQGLRVDCNYVAQKKEKLTYRINLLESKLRKTNFYKRWSHINRYVNINSNTQLSNYLYNVKGLTPPKFTDSGQGSTDDEALSMLPIPELDIILQIRKLKKVRDTYLEAFEREQIRGYLHPHFNLHLVKTYRSSSDSPNFQNIPKRDKESMQTCRRALYPRPGHQILEIDYSGLEVAIAACYHKDPTMVKYITDPASDMHGDMARQIFKLPSFDKKKEGHSILRNAAKNGFVFPQFYGDYYGNNAFYMAVNWCGLSNGKWKSGQGIKMDEGHISDHLIGKGVTSLEDFTSHIKEIEDDFWTNRFPEYDAWKERWYKLYQKHGYIVMKTGFQCSGLMSKNEVINAPVQGAAFHCLLWSFIEIDKVMRRENWDSRLIGQIHDAIVLDVHPDELEHVAKTVNEISTKKILEVWDWIIVPLRVEAELCPVDASWADKEEWKF